MKPDQSDKETALPSAIMAERAMTASLSSRPSHMRLSSSSHHANPNHCEMDEQLMTWIEQLWRHDATVMSCYSLGRQAGIVSVYSGSQRDVSSHSQSTPPSVELPS
eukprot:scaffold2993_cov73-Alexandrium_tamarense.AAC.1